jgi:hypothetical protein
METLGDGIRSGGESDKEREEEAEETAALLRDRLRLSVIAIASSHGQFFSYFAHVMIYYLNLYCYFFLL